MRLNEKKFIRTLMFLLLFLGTGCTDGYEQVWERRLRMSDCELGLGTYIVHGRLPATIVYNANGDVLGSWRLYLLHFIIGKVGEVPDYATPWNSAQNSKADAYAFAYCDEGSLNPAILAVIGDDSVLSPTQSARIDDVPDDAILLIEATGATFDWKEPGDFDLKWLDSDAGISKHPQPGNQHGSDFFIAFGDGKVWHMRGDTPRSLLKKFMTVSGAKSESRDERLAKYRIDD